jgi:uncharacterized membrane protein YhhN
MTSIQTILLASCCLCVIALLFAEARDSSPMRALFKLGASLSFVALALAGGALETGFGRVMLLALALCAVGDALLIRRNEAWFLGGMGAFAAGHIAFAVSFLMAGARLGPAAVIAFALAATAGLAVVLTLRRRLGAMLMPVTLYSAIIAFMCAAAVGLADFRPDIQHITIATAAIAFAVSDVSVALDQFVKRAFANRLWGLPLYFAAQVAFALSV